MTSGEGAPFVTVDDFAAAWRPLSGAERTTATRLLADAARWIREQYQRHFGEPIADDHPGAVSVSIDVVKTAMETGKYAGHTSYSRTEGPRARAGTLSAPGGSLAFTDWHKELLGISTRVMPVGNFPRDDY